MADAPALADPERALALAYAPADRRAGLAALFALDERLGQVVASTGEPMIGLMRLAWWREALENLDQETAPSEPLLAALARDALPFGVCGKRLADIEDGWAALVDGEPDAETIARHGRERGRNLFAAAARILGAEDDRVADAGEIWALVDLGYRHSQAGVREVARAQAADRARSIPSGPWPVRARALGALYVLARRDAEAEERAPGSPKRMLRMLALRLFGR